MPIKRRKIPTTTMARLSNSVPNGLHWDGDHIVLIKVDQNMCTNIRPIIYEGADRVRGRGEIRGREGGVEGEGGGRRGGGRRDRAFSHSFGNMACGD